MAGQQIYILALSASLNPHLFPTSDQVLLWNQKIHLTA
jgi:hypothetical protein